MAARTASLPAPVGGWNARDSLAAMSPSDAVTLTNWLPTPGEVALRAGYTNWSTGLPAQVETIFAYSGGATTKLFGLSNGAIYDCTAGGAVGAAAVSGLSNSRFQYINVATVGGNYLLAVNGLDKMRYFDGTTWSADGGTFTVTVADTSNWTAIALHKFRVWGIQKNTLKAYYLPTSSIAGAASLFDFSSIFRLGGSIVAVETWTVDGGFGLDDLLVFISSKGEVLIYRGTDPASASTWAMVGLFRIGAPVGGARCLLKWSGDLLVITTDGVVPLSQEIQSSRVEPKVALSSKIQFAVSSAVTAYQTNFGWQLLNFPKENQLFVNVPLAVGTQQQYVMNTLTKGWCNYTGWAANCWEIYNDDPYFGGSTVVSKAWSGTSDNGSNIQAYALQAFNYFRAPGRLKRFTMSRPIFRSNGSPAVFAGYAIDFDQTDTTAALSYAPPSSAGLWNTATWSVGLWGTAALSILKSWQGAQGIGYAAAPIVKIAARGLDVRWVSTDVVHELGGIL